MPIFWKCQLVGSALLLPVGILLRTAYWLDARLAFDLAVIIEPLAVILTLGLRQLYKKVGLQRSDVLKSIIISSLASLVSATLILGVSDFLLRRCEIDPAGSRLMRFCIFLLFFELWSVAYFWLRSEVISRTERKRLQELEASAERAELGMLRRHLNPHFLFSSLNNIAEEILDDPAAAVDMTRQLGRFLHFTMDFQDDQFVKLSEEADAVRNYLAIEEKRFRNRLTSEIRIPKGVGEVKLPRFLLLPLVENGVKHGVMSGSPPWKVLVDLQCDDASLHIRVSNVGTLMRDWENRGTGVGISNLRKRLELHYPGMHEFRLFQEKELVVSHLVLHGVSARKNVEPRLRELAASGVK